MTRTPCLACALFAACGTHHADPNVSVDAAAAIDAPSALGCGTGGDAHVASIDQLNAALHSPRAYPYPGGWGACSGQAFCNDPMPAMSFDQGFQIAECGQNYEHGFESGLTYPMTVLALDGGRYAIEVEVATNQHTRWDVTPLGPIDAPTGLRLVSQATQQIAIFAPLPPLP